MARIAHLVVIRDAGARDAFIDALDVVCSRTVRCGSNLVLAPLLDMANHDANGGHYFVLDEEHVALAAPDAGVSVGEPITLNYGERSNADWLCHYGFLPSPNRTGPELKSTGHKADCPRGT